MGWLRWRESRGGRAQALQLDVDRPEDLAVEGGVLLGRCALGGLAQEVAPLAVELEQLRVERLAPGDGLVELGLPLLRRKALQLLRQVLRVQDPTFTLTSPRRDDWSSMRP